jgi:hypothetical protein
VVDHNGITPPSSGGSDASSSNSLPKQIQTGMSRSYEVKGNSAIRSWAQHFFPQMTSDDLDTFIQEFLMTICQQVCVQVKKELENARKQARKLREAEEGED